MTNEGDANFKSETFLTTEGNGRKFIHLMPRDVFFSQGAESNCVFYLQTGRAKLTVVSKVGKEATITLLAAGDFIGEEAIAGAGGLRMATATAISSCTALKIDRDEMARVLHQERSFSDFLRASSFTAVCGHRLIW
jgi:CRP/FNR family cyclic AMP-dependent transcriptional regulator